MDAFRDNNKTKSKNQFIAKITLNNVEYHPPTNLTLNPFASNICLINSLLSP